MPTNNQNTSSSDQDPMQDLLQAVQSAAERHWRHLLVVLLAIIAVLLGYHNWRSRKDAELAETWRALNQMPPIQSLRYQQDRQKRLDEVITKCKSILSERWDTSATPWVLLKLGNAQIQAERMLAADKTLATLQRDFPEHYAAKMAQTIRGGVKEDIKEYEKAARIYSEVARQQAGESDQWVDTGRAWEMAGKKKLALSAYDKILDDNSGLSLARFRRNIIIRTGELLPSLPPRPEPEKRPEGVESSADEDAKAPSPAQTKDEKTKGPPAPSESSSE